jgi:exodeoxyribonuclease VII large subunit
MAYDEITKVISVTECNLLIKELLDTGFYQIVVRGEISGTYFRPNASGHYYFDLKDAQSSLPSCVFRSCARGLEKFRIGDLVVATGRISLYEKTGKLTFVINRMVKEGDGELQALIEKRKLYYQNLGWFDPQNKPEIPSVIRKVGVVTSATGAVIHDILDVTRRRAPSLDIVLLPCAVQGKGAEDTIASRIRQANNFSLCDVLIVARGGGSKEDLMPYNEVAVIEAIHESKIPVISAVGHESDWSLSDYVATLRAGTPSIAAEKVTETIYRRRQSFSSIRDTMNLIMKNRIASARAELPSPQVMESLMKTKLAEARRAVPSPEEMKVLLEKKRQNAFFRFNFSEEEMRSALIKKSENARQKVEYLKSAFALTLPRIIENGRHVIDEYRRTSKILVTSTVSYSREKLKSTRREMNALNPLSLLERGFALVRDENGRIVTSAESVHAGDTLNIRVKDGSIRAEVKENR